MKPRGPYVLGSVGIAGLYAWAMSGDWMGAACLAFVGWLVISIVAWEARRV